MLFIEKIQNYLCGLKFCSSEQISGSYRLKSFKKDITKM
jgi:hypothetical protein